MIKVLSFWYSKIVLRFFTDNEKIIYRNLERITKKLENNKSHLMFNETCYNNDIFPTSTNIIIRNKIIWVTKKRVLVSSFYHMYIFCV